MRYDKACLSNACGTAKYLAEKDGRLRFVYASYVGYQISLRDPKLTGNDYFCFGASDYAKIEYQNGRFNWDRRTYETEKRG